MNGQTSGLRLEGSDETDTDERERRRRMPAERAARNNARLTDALDAYRRHHCGRYGCDVLLIRTRFQERLDGRLRALMRRRAAGLVRTAVRLTCLPAGHACDHARRGWKSDGREKKRKSDEK